MVEHKIKVVEERTANKNKDRKTPLSTIIWILVGIFIGLPLLIVIIALIVGMGSASTTVNSDNLTSTNSNITSNSSVTSSTSPSLSANLSIDKISIVASNLYPVRVSIQNTGTKIIYPKFDMVAKNKNNETVCEESPITDDIGTIYSGESKTGELNFLGCMFNKDGNYTLYITLLDDKYTKIAESSKEFIVSYWGQFDIGSTTNTDSSNNTAPKVYDANIKINKVNVKLANLYPIRVTIGNKGSSFEPGFDVTVTQDGDVVCDGSANTYDISELDANTTKTIEITLYGCMFDRDGDYMLNVDLLSPDYKILSSDKKSFSVDYWSQFS